MRTWFSFHIGEIAAVASRTASSDARMVHHRWFEGGSGFVAGFASSSSWYVRACFA